MALKTYRKILDNVTAAGAGEWFETNWKYSTSDLISFAGTLTSGDSITIELAADEERTVVTTMDYSTTSFADTAGGPWVAIRAVKTGTTGPATVVALF